jgi:hypothetical protein
MRNGFHVYDTDTPVNPAAAVLERYMGPAFGRAGRVIGSGSASHPMPFGDQKEELR